VRINAQRQTRKYRESRFERRDVYPVAVASFGGMDEGSSISSPTSPLSQVEEDSTSAPRPTPTSALSPPPLWCEATPRLAEAAILYARRPHRSLVRRSNSTSAAKLKDSY
jgi:hypothetical protein